VNECVEFEIRIDRADDQHVLDVVITQPDSDVDIRPLAGSALPLALDPVALDALVDDDEAYGAALTQALFTNEDVRGVFLRAASVAQSLDKPLRVRLNISSNASELQRLRWELLAHPEGGPLVTREDVFFSRFVSSRDFRRVPLRPRSELRALVAAANPVNLTQKWPALAPIDTARAYADAAKALGDIPSVTFGANERVTFDAILARLRDGYDILYLVCHGSLTSEGEPFLVLEDDQGQAAPVRGDDIVMQLGELWQRPRLIVLAACQTAAHAAPAGTRTTSPALTALGPRLADAGIAAVVAMQGAVSMETAGELMPAFFTELARDGVIDRAMAAARARVRTRPDGWMPALFMRLRSGRMWWYQTGFRTEFNRWVALVADIASGRCTPILGPGITDALVGSRRDTARRMAEAYDYPMAAHEREDLPQVAQFLSTKQSPTTVPWLVLGHLCREIVQRYGHRLPPALANAPLDGLGRDELALRYEELLETIWRQRLETESHEPHRMLASLPFRLYITTNPEQLLVKALAETRTPHSEICRWNAELADLPSIFDPPAASALAPAGASEPYRLDAQRPLVYQLFGTLARPESLVITEDDYFDFLIGVTANKDLIPKPVRRALADSALLFLGFQLDDWDFRVLFRSIAGQEGARRRQSYAHIAVQVDPEEGRVQRPDQAREFLNAYFQNADISIFWGTVEDFVKELSRHWTGPTHLAGVAAAGGSR
jgi:CHAT domain-containing protein/SIR2-like protein